MILVHAIASVIYYISVIAIIDVADPMAFALYMAVLLGLPAILGFLIQLRSRASSGIAMRLLRSYAGWGIGSLAVSFLVMAPSCYAWGCIANGGSVFVVALPASIYSGATILPIVSRTKRRREQDAADPSVRPWRFEDTPAIARWIMATLIAAGIAVTASRAYLTTRWMDRIPGENVAIWITEEYFRLGAWHQARVSKESGVVVLCYVDELMSSPVYIVFSVTDDGEELSPNLQTAIVTRSRVEAIAAGKTIQSSPVHNNTLRTLGDVVENVDMSPTQ